MTGKTIRRQLSLATRRELIEAISERYHAAGRADKKRILDEFIEVTGFHRKHALRRSLADAAVKASPAGSRTYDQAVVEGLTILWEASDRICGKRLKCAIPTLLEAMGAARACEAQPGGAPTDSRGECGDHRPIAGADARSGQAGSSQERDQHALAKEHRGADIRRLE